MDSHAGEEENASGDESDNFDRNTDDELEIQSNAMDSHAGEASSPNYCRSELFRELVGMGFSDKLVSKALVENGQPRCHLLTTGWSVFVSAKKLVIHRLVYTNSGRVVLALTSTGVHKLWRWPTSNTINVASVDASPQLWGPPSGEVMNNIVDPRNPEAAVHSSPATRPSVDAVLFSYHELFIRIFREMQ